MGKRSAVAVALGVLLLGTVVALVGSRDDDPVEAPAREARSPRTRTLPGPSEPTPPPRGTLSVRGRVVDESGNPVAGADVSATRAMPGESLSALPCDVQTPDVPMSSIDCVGEATDVLTELVLAERGGAPMLAHTTSAEDGSFVLDALPEGTVALWAFAGEDSALAPEVATGSDGVDLVLELGLAIAGRVVDEAGGPIASAQVKLFHTAHSRYFDASTDADGRFSLGPLPTGEYSLVASSPGLLPTYLLDVAYEDLESITLHRPRRIRGQVLLEGRPAPGAEVRLPYSLHVAVTDGDGRFVLEDISPGSYEVFAERDGLHGYANADLDETATDVEITVHLGTLVYVEGLVLDEAGQPVTGAVVSTYPGEDAPTAEDAITGADGRFRLGPLVPGAHSFSVDADGFLALEPEDVEVSASGPPLVFTLERAVVLAGIVIDTEGRPLADVDVEAMKAGRPTRRRRNVRRHLPNHHAPLIFHQGRSAVEEEEPPPLEEEVDLSDDARSTSSDEDGRFLFELPEPGRYVITAGGGSHLFTKAEADAPTTEVRLVVRTGAKVEGTVVDARGAPLFQVRITLKLPSDGEDDERLVMSDEQGHFSLEGLPPGGHTLQAVLDRGGTLHRTSHAFSVSGAEPVEVSLRLDTGHSVSGVVVDEHGRPVEAAEVRAYTLQQQPEDRDGHRPSTATTGPDGRFTVDALVEGPCVLSASKNGYTFDEPELGKGQARPGVVTRAGAGDVRLVLLYQGYLRGRVVREDGTPVSPFTINQLSFRDPGGAFELPMDNPGSMELRFDAPGLTRAVLDVKVPRGRDLDLGLVRLTRGRQVKGRVVDGVTSQPVARASVQVSIVGEDEWMSEHSPLAEAQTSVDGTFTLPPLEARALVLKVKHRGYPLLRQRIGVGDETLELRLFSGARVEGTVTDREGRPMDTTVMLEPLSWSGSTTRVKTAGGTFALQGMEAGNYAVHSLGTTGADGRRVEFMPQRVYLPPTGPVTLAISERAGGATLRLHFRLELPNPVAGMYTALVPGPVSPEATHEELLTLTRHQSMPRTRSGGGPSELVYERLPGGRYTFLFLLQLDRERYAVHREELDIPEGASLEHELRTVWTPVPDSR
ncbi:carboxypeptidase regulatory-like domain-containing protein [Pyxidicoccus xibeiensis]|uniref:carboxypeptidase regulatory-like domain-containing protein n=1 Tax=Pyxidicoccus xibeiensis TaxID=2906759 RepID=UPI0020A6FDF1|nr:carboxypeptidase regulatory-like domain-containing protein [Pyxidicoccus xibeiensis]MCP3136924.1 carboxypeptidase regulatory-like domain-containing protein [Pyxidicoccus xibeiensis]